MEESKFLLKLKFVLALALTKFLNLLLCVETVSTLSVILSNPLFSCIVSFCTLILLYLPNFFTKIVFSPVLILTGTLLLTILRLGAIQKSQKEQKENMGIPETISNQEGRASKEEKEENLIELDNTHSLEHVHQWVAKHSELEFKSQMGFDSSLCFEKSLMNWNVKAPLEVIYEDYEGEEAEEDRYVKEDTSQMGITRHPSLSRYYPESDSDSSSDGGFSLIGKCDSPDNICVRWDEEDREGLIEIAIDGGKKKGLVFHFEEENLIEIDISSPRDNDFSGENQLFSGEITCN